MKKYKILFLLIFVITGCYKPIQYQTYKNYVKKGFEWEKQMISDKNITIQELRDSLDYDFKVLSYKKWIKRTTNF